MMNILKLYGLLFLFLLLGIALIEVVLIIETTGLP